MAYYRKRSLAKRSRYRRYRRFNRRYRRSRYGRFRRYSRYRRISRKTEVKYHQASTNHNWDFTQISKSLNNVSDPLPFYPGRILCVPTSLAMTIYAGTGQGERIGAKISPVKLRINGVVSYEAPPSLEGQFYNPSLNNQSTYLPFEEFSILPHSFHVRCIVYQIKGGRAGDVAPLSGEFHPLDIPTVSSGIVSTYEDNFNRVSGKNLNILLEDYRFTPAAEDSYTRDIILQNMGASKSPFRKGIGSYVKILYQHTYVLQTGSRTSIPFRFVTKKPRRIVWPEQLSTNGIADVGLAENPRNPIYILWYVVPQAFRPLGYIFVKQNVELYYTDT